MSKQKYTAEITCETNSKEEFVEKMNFLTTILSNLEHDVLKIVAEKSTKFGINTTIRLNKKLL